MSFGFWKLEWTSTRQAELKKVPRGQWECSRQKNPCSFLHLAQATRMGLQPGSGVHRVLTNLPDGENSTGQQKS